MGNRSWVDDLPKKKRINPLKIGRFQVSQPLEKSFSKNQLRAIFNGVYVYLIEDRPEHRGYWSIYFAFSDKFRELKERELIPMYECLCETKENGSVKVTWKEEK